MGKGSKPTVGYWYRVLYHAGLCTGPIDTFLEFRGGDKTAWSGYLDSSTTLSINAPQLWGGEKDQGGIVGDVDLMFGEPTQLQNPYLLSNLGSQIPSWRGLATLVFKGGKFGAMNPYPQKPSYKICKIKKGWDGDECWYPEKAALVMGSEQVTKTYPSQMPDWKYRQISRTDDTDYSAPNYNDSAWSTGAAPFGGWEAGWTSDNVASGAPDKLNAATAYDARFASAFGTHWDVNTRLWLRRTINLPGTPTGKLKCRIYIEDHCVVYINGTNVLATPADHDGGIGQYFEITNHHLVAGNNVIALRCDDEAPADGISAVYVDFIFEIDVIISVQGMNPAHVLYYSRTNSEMGREATANINDASLRAAADWFFSQNFGICTTRDPSKESPADFEKRICKLTGSSFSRSLTDGQWYLDVANGQYTLANLPILTDDDILDFKELPAQLDSAVNSVSIKYFDVQTKEEPITAPVRALGLVTSFGTIHQTNEYPEIPVSDLALRVAQRDLLTTSTPSSSFDLVVTRKAYSWRPNQYFRLQSPKRGIADMVCIIGELEHGTLRSGAIKLKASQDIYSLPLTTYVEHEPGVDTRPNQTPVDIVNQKVFESPYIDIVRWMPSASLSQLDDEAGFAMAVAIDPSRSRNYTMVTASPGGQYSEAATGEWCPSAVIVDACDRTTTSLSLSQGIDLDQVPLGSAALWDDEVVRVDALDRVAGTATISRGCADTVPAVHDAGSRIWFYQDASAIDMIEYNADETINVKLLTNTGSQQLALLDASTASVTFSQRWARPYPPANVKINTSDWPSSVTGSFDVSWASRNRTTQSDQLIDASVASISPEINVRYGLRVRRVDTGEVLVERANIGAVAASVSLSYSGDVVMELWTLSDIGESFQKHTHQFNYTAADGTAQSTITAPAFIPVDDSTIVDGGGDDEDTSSWGGIVHDGLYPMLNDGTHLVGKVRITLSSGQQDRIVNSGDNGLTWALGAFDAGFEVTHVAFGGGRYVAAGGAGWFGYADTVDGAWTSAQKTNYPVAGVTGGLGMVGLIYDGTKFVAAGACGIVLTSSDGSAWAEVSSNALQTGGYGSGSFRFITRSGSTFYAIFVSNGGYPEKLYSSTDLQTWSALYTNSDTSKSLKAVRILNGKIVLVGSKTVSGNGRPLMLASSDAGATWTDVSPVPSSGNPLFISLADAAYFNGHYVIFGQNIEGYSDDLSTWVLTEPISPQTTSNRIQNGTALVAVRVESYSGVATLRRTTNGTAWTTINL